jgi:hypothetical protein
LVLSASAAVGLLANVQTYSFLTAVYLLVYVVAAYGLLTARSYRLLIVSAGLLVLVLLGGQTLAGHVGPLATLIAGALPALPGFLVVLKRLPVLFAFSAVALLLSAAPTVLGTLSGVASKDPFLVYREASSSNLGVPLNYGVIGALVPLLLVLAILAAGIHARQRLWTAYSAGVLVAWPLVASNDLWGANQEPYRFWIDAFTLVTATAVPIFALVIVHYWRAKRSRGTTPVGVEDGTRASLRPGVRYPGLWVPVTAAAILAVVAIPSGLDYVKFRNYVTAAGTASFDDPQALAIKAVTASVSKDANAAVNGLLLNDPCLSPFRLKAVSGGPVAFYNLGLAWPEKEPQIRQVLGERDQGILDLAHVRSAGIGFIVTDTSCAQGWSAKALGQKVASATYPLGAGANAEVALWKVP